MLRRNLCLKIWFSLNGESVSFFEAVYQMERLFFVFPVLLRRVFKSHS